MIGVIREPDPVRDLATRCRRLIEGATWTVMSGVRVPIRSGFPGNVIMNTEETNGLSVKLTVPVDDVFSAARSVNFDEFFGRTWRLVGRPAYGLLSIRSVLPRSVIVPP
jgi:hypothetical protein